MFVCSCVPTQPCVSVYCHVRACCSCSAPPPPTDELECDTSGCSDLPVSSQAPGPRAPLSWLFLSRHSEDGGTHTLCHHVHDAKHFLSHVLIAQVEQSSNFTTGHRVCIQKLLRTKSSKKIPRMRNSEFSINLKRRSG